MVMFSLALLKFLPIDELHLSMMSVGTAVSATVLHSQALGSVPSMAQQSQYTLVHRYRAARLPELWSHPTLLAQL